jgi:hypothetical protein
MLMSRGDEFEAGSPRQPGGRDDDAAKRWGDDDEVPITKSQRSGLVTTAGIVGILWGAWDILAAGCAALTPIVAPALADLAAKAKPNDPNAAKLNELLNQVPTWYILLMAGVGLVVGLAVVGASVGVLRRSNIARLALVALAGFEFLLFVVRLIVGFALVGVETSGVIGSACTGTVTIAFVIFVCVCLLPAARAAEFRA